MFFFCFSRLLDDPVLLESLSQVDMILNKFTFFFMNYSFHLSHLPERYQGSQELIHLYTRPNFCDTVFRSNCTYQRSGFLRLCSHCTIIIIHEYIAFGFVLMLRQNVQEYTNFRNLWPLAASDLGRGLQNNLPGYQLKLFNLF